VEPDTKHGNHHTMIAAMLIKQIYFSLGTITIRGSQLVFEHAEIAAQGRMQNSILSFAREWCAKPDKSGHSNHWEISAAIAG
jgi:hypothetical protein